MTDLKYAILEKLYFNSRREVHQAELFNIDIYRINEISLAMSDLVSFELIERVIGSNKYHLTTPGIKSFELAKNVRDQASKQEKQQRFDNKMSIANILVPLVTFILGILVDHFANIVSWFLSFFK